jgi:hypothetical protein
MVPHPGLAGTRREKSSFVNLHSTPLLKMMRPKDLEHPYAFALVLALCPRMGAQRQEMSDVNLVDIQGRSWMLVLGAVSSAAAAPERGNAYAQFAGGQARPVAAYRVPTRVPPQERAWGASDTRWLSDRLANCISMTLLLPL